MQPTQPYDGYAAPLTQPATPTPESLGGPGGGTVWDTFNLFDYIHGGTPSPDRSQTPSPVLPVPPTTAYVAVPTMPSYVLPAPPPPPPWPWPQWSFVHGLPRVMQPHARTPTYLSDNGVVEYYAFAGADGVGKVCLIGRVADIQALCAGLSGQPR